uniref:He65 n=3 Tax=Anticarsia gemmatalis multiple nucleopolyhedrovirus TaxID=268591 RepID=A0A0S3IUX3_9ABAC|nr:he65 [Anticarsia gemmatalis multiple nucleopolyhedrovirus]ALR70808.1 he65 [Anticarsia gemmatalis multiple nucleopolyhedrovirus]ALR71281.1 he65 [Anticarsia gemmatalis multiple nucleopolyhedrovirus]ALR71439.1 he65 [Anticarsia gemmatalis multiple nucleopolyhedrovirus]ALR72065.1 he65 [Anticarsia gemmatalis multiple nucleopolyhedrovirus]
MVYIKIDTGSRAKGYAADDSDADYKIYEKCEKETFAKFVFNKQELVNKHTKDEKGNDVVIIDLNVGLHGVFTGKSPDLGIFTKPADCKDKYGQENVQLYRYLKKLTLVSMVKIVRRMLKFAVLTNAKRLLQLMFNCTYSEYYLDYKKLPESTKILNMLLNLDDSVHLVTNSLCQLIVNNVHVVPIADKMADIKINDKLIITFKNTNKLKIYAELMQRGEYREEWGTFFTSWLQELNDRMKYVPDPPERADVLHSIIMYALNERGPVMPEDENIFNKIYPSISHLDYRKKNTLADKQILVQEKLDGCNYRVIVHDNAVTFGSRNTYRPDVEFMNVHRISAHLQTCALSLKQLMECDSFVVFGELLGWKTEAKNQPLNVIKYTQQKESLKYYAYEIQLNDDAFVPFETAQILLQNAGFYTIPYRKCLYNDFVKDLHFKSEMFTDSPLEGYIIRCGKLIYKLKPDYKDLNKLQIDSRSFDFLNCDELEKECALSGKLNFEDILRHCRKKYVCNKSEGTPLFNKLYNMYRKRFNFNHKDYKRLYSLYCKDLL